jgi:hypothetical protein
MAWILNEDLAMKVMLQGIRVTDANAPSNGRPVPVIYRLPETEVVDYTPPIIIIEHIGWFRDPARQHSGFVQIPYAPEGYPTWWADSGGLYPALDSFDPTDSPYRAYFPIPYNFDYKIEVHTRLQHEHMIPIVAALAQPGRLYDQWSYLNIPQDGTQRTMLLNGGPEMTYGKDQDDKHIFVTTYNVRVCSELLGPIDAPAAYGGSTVLATQLNVDLDVYTDLADVTPDEQISLGLLSVGMTSSWNTQ